MSREAMCSEELVHVLHDGYKSEYPLVDLPEEFAQETVIYSELNDGHLVQEDSL